MICQCYVVSLVCILVACLICLPVWVFVEWLIMVGGLIVLFSFCDFYSLLFGFYALFVMCDCCVLCVLFTCCLSG